MSDNRYTNTVKAAAYSLGVDVDILQQSLEHMRRATELRKGIKSETETQYISINLVVRPSETNEQR